jgi:hypothetical protein
LQARLQARGQARGQAREQARGQARGDKLAFINPQFWLKEKPNRVHYYTSCKYIQKCRFYF